MINKKRGYRVILKNGLLEGFLENTEEAEDIQAK